MDRMYSMLKKSRKDLPVYIYSTKLADLKSFTSGYALALAYRNLEAGFGFFRFFVAGYYGEFFSTAGWGHLIDNNNHNKSDQEKLNIFYCLLEKYYNNDWLTGLEHEGLSNEYSADFYETFKKPSYGLLPSGMCLQNLVNGYILSKINESEIVLTFVSFLTYVAGSKDLDMSSWIDIFGDNADDENIIDNFYHKLEMYYKTKDV